LCEQVEVISAIDWVSGIWTLDRTESCNRRPLYFKDLSDGSKVYFGSATAYRDSSSSSYGGYVVTTEANKCTVNGDQYTRLITQLILCTCRMGCGNIDTMVCGTPIVTSRLIVSRRACRLQSRPLF
jgi:hypothetical protein